MLLVIGIRFIFWLGGSIGFLLSHGLNASEAYFTKPAKLLATCCIGAPLGRPEA
jgi:hypothetical protein